MADAKGRGRPKGTTKEKISSENSIFKSENNGLSPDILEKLRKLEEENQKLKEQFKKSGEKYKFIPNSTKVRIRSNIDGKFIASDDKTKIRLYFELPNYGDEVVLDYDEINVLKTSKGNYFKKGILALIDVVSESNDITLNDVIKDIRVEKEYSNYKINPTNFEVLFTDDVSFKTFEKFLLEHPLMAETIMIISTILYKQGKLNDNGKMSYLKQAFNNDNLYR